MADLGFFASTDDRRAVLSYLISEHQAQIYETLCEPNRELRGFSSLGNLESKLDLDWTNSLNFHVHIPGVLAPPEVKTFDLAVAPWGTKQRLANTLHLQLHFVGLEQGSMRRCRWAHHEEAGARSDPNSAADRVNWPLLRRVSGQIQRRIRKTLSAGAVNRQEILAGAFARLSTGTPIFLFGETLTIDSAAIERKLS